MTVLTQLKCRWHQLVSDCHSSIMFRLNNLFKKSLWIYKDFTPNSENQLRNLEINENPLEFINQKRDIHPKKNYVKHSYRLILHDRFQFSWMWNEKSCKKIMDLKVVATVVVIHWILTDVKPNASWKSIKRFTFFLLILKVSFDNLYNFHRWREMYQNRWTFVSLRFNRFTSVYCRTPSPSVFFHILLLIIFIILIISFFFQCTSRNKHLGNGRSRSRSGASVSTQTLPKIPAGGPSL